MMAQCKCYSKLGNDVQTKWWAEGQVISNIHHLLATLTVSPPTQGAYVLGSRGPIKPIAV